MVLNSKPKLRNYENSKKCSVFEGKIEKMTKNDKNRWPKNTINKIIKIKLKLNL